jgi:hypothetical protein
MIKFNKAVVLAGAVALLACGCAAKKINTTDVPNSPEEPKVVVAPTPVPQPSATPVPVGQKYVVKKGDTLWSISRQTGIYSNSFEWPLIFKTNRDEIVDPDEIEVGEVLMIQQGISSDQIKRAIQLASDTPAFVAHAKPRKPLPIDYF